MDDKNFSEYESHIDNIIGQYKNQLERIKQTRNKYQSKLPQNRQTCIKTRTLGNKERKQYQTESPNCNHSFSNSAEEETSKLPIKSNEIISLNPNIRSEKQEAKESTEFKEKYYQACKDLEGNLKEINKMSKENKTLTKQIEERKSRIENVQGELNAKKKENFMLAEELNCNSKILQKLKLFLTNNAKYVSDSAFSYSIDEDLEDSLKMFENFFTKIYTDNQDLVKLVKRLKNKSADEKVKNLNVQVEDLKIENSILK